MKYIVQFPLIFNGQRIEVGSSVGDDILYGTMMQAKLPIATLVAKKHISPMVEAQVPATPGQAPASDSDKKKGGL